MTFGRRVVELRVALMLLTRLPAGRGGVVPAIADAGWAFPVCGALVGAVAWLALAAASAVGLPPAISAVLAVAAAILVTGGLHEDGLADFVDGIGGGQDRDGKLAIMRDSRIGSYGVIALVLSLGLRALAVAETASAGGTLAAFVALGGASRCLMLLTMALSPPAREDGLARTAGVPGMARLAAGLVVTGILLVPLGEAALAIAAVMALAGGAVALLAERQIGGQTGDVLGAVQNVSEVAGWLTIVVVAAT